MVLFLVLSSPLAAQDIVQYTKGPCSPAIAGVGGNVALEIHCNGVSPDVLARLESQIADNQRNWASLQTKVNAISDAVTSLQQMLSDPSVPAIVRSLLEEGRIVEARSRLQEIVDDTPTIDPTAAAQHYQLGMIYKIELDYAEALGHFEQAHRLDPTDPQIGVMYAQLLTQLGRIDAAIEVLERTRRTVEGTAAIGGDPSDLVNVVTTLARTYGASGDLESAKELLFDLGEKAAQDTRLQSVANRAMGLVLRDLGSLYWAEGDMENAHELFARSVASLRQECLKIQTGGLQHVDDCHGLADALTAYGAFSLMLRKWSEAEELYSDALGIYEELARALDVPKSSVSPLMVLEAQVGLARVYSIADRSDEAYSLVREALPAAEQAALMNPMWTSYHAWCRLILGSLALFALDYQEADQQLRQAVALWRIVLESEPGVRSQNELVFTQALASHATAADMLGDHQAAVRRAEEAVGVLQPRFDSGIAFQSRRARILYGQALRALGSALVKSGSFSQGCSNLREAATVTDGTRLASVVRHELQEYCF